MPIPDRGEKHTCLSCETRFYDLKRPQAICPKCGVDQATEAARIQAATPKRKTRAKAVAQPKVVKAEEPAPAEDAEAEVEDEDLDSDDDEDEDDDDVE